MPYPTSGKPANHGKSIHNAATYEALMNQGMSKSKAAAISNAALNKSGHKGRHRRKSHS